MHRLSGIFLVLVALLVAACDAAPTPTQAPINTPNRTPDTTRAQDPTALPATETRSNPTATSQIAIVTVDPALNRPDEPAQGEMFRPDDPSHVAATGRPQLIEFYSET